MLTTTMDPPLQETLHGTAHPAPPEPGARVAPAPSAPLPARLLSRDADDGPGNVRRLGLGFLGLASLGLLPDAALALARDPDWKLGALDWVLVLALDAASLPVAAVLTVTFALPGLLILLGVLDQPVAPAAMFQAVSRAYYRVGLLALGATPTLVLFALTGASPDTISVGVALCYVGSGVLSLAVLLRELLGSLGERRGFAPLVLLGWAAFVALFGLHLLNRLNVEPWI